MYKVKLVFHRCLGSYLKISLPWRRYGYSMDQHNFDCFIIYNVHATFFCKSMLGKHKVWKKY